MTSLLTKSAIRSAFATWSSSSRHSGSSCPPIARRSICLWLRLKHLFETIFKKISILMLHYSAQSCLSCTKKPVACSAVNKAPSDHVDSVVVMLLLLLLFVAGTAADITPKLVLTQIFLHIHSATGKCLVLPGINRRKHERSHALCARMLFGQNYIVTQCS